MSAEVLPLLEGVSGAANCSNRVGPTPHFQNLPQAPHMHVDCAIIDGDAWAPYAVANLLSGKDGSGVRHQEFEKPEPDRAEVELATCPIHPTCAAVEFDVA